MKIATLAIIVRDGKVLLGEKKKGEIGTGTLNGPGGKQEPGEELADCLIRETKEELEIELLPEQLEKVAIVTFYAAGVADFEVHVFRAEEFRGELKETADMIPSWHNIEELPYERMLDSDKKWFGKAAWGEKFSAKVFYRTRAADFEQIEFLPAAF